ncbi:TrbG/VirB9 family P-type conjugative transfer protein [Sphingomonas daechungensis]|uniref:TrbG/VirB9 family P-type conjugative transfer protein n=1 Tax=Sphingomonas daechungensis TaxID=1176646 RepID=UPI00378357C5
MMRIPAAALAFALLSTPVYAADPRLQSVHYQPDTVVKVQGRLGYQSMIEFASGESIENVAVGDSSAWQVTPNKRANLLFLKPLMPSAQTNMTVVTDQRTYLFDLSVAKAGATPMYNLRFTYGATPPAPTQSQPQRIGYPTLLASAPSSPPAVVAPKINYDWKQKGDKEIQPSRVYDDGRSLYLQWAAGAAMPALFERDEDGREGLLNYRQQGSFVVVDSVPNTLVMRLGKDTALLVNRHPTKEQPLRVAER